jgi:hypothetical protein
MPLIAIKKCIHQLLIVLAEHGVTPDGYRCCEKATSLLIAAEEEGAGKASRFQKKAGLAAG